MMKKRPPPFEFVLEQLRLLNPVVKPMFGCHAIYIEEKIMLVLRKKKSDCDNGVWLASAVAHHVELRKILPSLRSISIFGTGRSGWLNIPEDNGRFEEEVMIACDLISKQDARIGKVPSLKKKRINLKH
jgi:hypothetical protein